MIAEQYAYFPALNATLNGTSAVLLLTGRVLIAKGRIAAHRACMIAAVIASALFLGCYLFFHCKVGNIRFLGQGWARPSLFRDSDFARHAGHRDCAAGDHHAEPRAEGALSHSIAPSRAGPGRCGCTFP